MSTDDSARKKEWLEKVKREGKLTRNPTEDHKFGLKVLQNTLRRNILISVGKGEKSYEEIKEEFKLNDYQAKFHLSMLEDALYIEKEEDDGENAYYLPTPRGEGFLENVEDKKEK